MRACEVDSLFEASTYVVYIKEGYLIPRVCTFIEGFISWSEGQCTKGNLSLRQKTTIKVLVSQLHSLLSCGNNPQCLPCPLFLLKFAFHKLEALGVLMAPLEFSLQIVDNYYAFVFVYLMQSLIYVLWMKNVEWLSLWKASGVYICLIKLKFYLLWRYLSH